MKIETKPSVCGFLAAIYFLFAVALCLSASCAYTIRTPATARHLKDQGAHTVKVEVFCIDKDPFIIGSVHMSGGHGSGVVIDNRHVLTAGHVIACQYLSDVHVVFENGKRYRVVVEKEWKTHDVARLELASADSFNPADSPQIAQIPLAGETLCSSTGYPERGGNCGPVTSTGLDHCGNGWCYDTRFEARSAPGNSGSPVYDEFGALVAILTGGSPSGFTVASSLWAIRDEIFD